LPVLLSRTDAPARFLFPLSGSNWADSLTPKKPLASGKTLPGKYYRGEPTEAVRFRFCNEASPVFEFLAAFPNFHQTVTEGKHVVGAICFKKGEAELVDVSLGLLETYDHLPDLFRSIHTNAQNSGMASGFPTFLSFDRGGSDWMMRCVFLPVASVEIRNIKLIDLGPAGPGDVPSLFRAVHDYAVKKGFEGGYPTFGPVSSGTEIGGYECVLIKKGKAQRHDLLTNWKGSPGDW